MSAIDDLQAGLQALAAQVAAVQTTAKDLVAQVVILQAAVVAGDDTAIVAATAQVAALTTQLATVALSDPGWQPAQAMDPESQFPLYSLADATVAVEPPWAAVTDVTGTLLGETVTLYSNSNDTADQPPSQGSSVWPPYLGPLTTT